MRPKPRPNNVFTTTLSAVLTIGFLWFFLFPSSPVRNPSIHRPYQPSRRNSGGIITRFDLRNVTSTSQALRNREKVLILTPVARWYNEYWMNLMKLSYPRELIDLGFIIPKGAEGDAVLGKLKARLKEVQGKDSIVDEKFNHVTILRQDVETPTSQNERDRHALENQKARRSTLSIARNSLLMTTLAPHISWVLWLDADIIETPTTLIQDLTSFNRDIIVANAFQKYIDKDGSQQQRAYDFNNWIDSETALDLAANMDDDDVLFEGYSQIPTYRTLMAYLYEPGRDTREIIQLDGVGTTALMVKASVHRDGASFPAFPFYHLLESEGFAKMARRLGYTCWGLPQYLVYHYNE